ncbi:TPA: abortive phage resistance protein [Escherichia coli]
MMNPVPWLQMTNMISYQGLVRTFPKAKMISVKLGLQDISEWLEHELNGYPRLDQVPDYRIITNAPVKAFNPYVGWIPYQLGNVEDKELYKSLTTIRISNPVSMLIEYAKKEDTLYSELPVFMADFLQKMAGCEYSMSWVINPAQITKILSHIKSKVLDWALLLESKNILGEGLLFSPEEKQEAVGMTVNNINNFNGHVNNSGAIGAGNTGDIHQQNTITAGDFNSLERQLKEYGIEDNDIRDLKLAIDQSSAPTSSNNLGGKIGNWVGSMIGKAYSGSLKIAGTAAPALLTNAICAYFNIPV